MSLVGRDGVYRWSYISQRIDVRTGPRALNALWMCVWGTPCQTDVGLSKEVICLHYPIETF